MNDLKPDSDQLQDMEILKILLAEDEPDVLEVMAKKVANNGYEVVTAVDGQEAWDKIVQESPDIVILDINMPRMDGFQVLKLLREEPPGGKWIPVIIVSARAEIADIDQGFSLQADHYITKPCHVDDVLKGIRLMAMLIPQRRSPTDSS